jgi:hypothetical protein
MARHRVHRGGGVEGFARAVNSTYRPPHPQSLVGFRVVCEIDGGVQLPPPEAKKPEPPAVAPVPRLKP